MKHNLDEPFRIVGHWMPAINRERRIAGQLTYDPARGIELEVNGWFDEIPQFLAPEGDPNEVILGETRTEIVTLLRCSYSGASFATGGTGHTTYRAQCVIFDCHIVDEVTPEFDEFTFTMPLFDKWWPVSGLSHQVFTDDQGRVQGFQHTYNPPDDDEVEIPGGKLRIKSRGVGGGNVADRSAHIRESIAITARLDAPISIWSGIDECIAPLRDLTTLLTGYPARLAKVAVVSDVENQREPGSTRRQSLDVVFRQTIDADELPGKLDSSRFLLSADAPECPPATEVIRRWYEGAATLERAKDLLFAMYRTPRGTFVENRFLMLAQAAEVFHRQHPAMKQLSMSRDEFRRRLALLDAIAEEEVQKWLRGKLHFANEVTLAERLAELLDYATGTSPDLWPDTMIRKIVNTRNYLVHGGEELERKAASGASLFYLKDYLQFLVRACLLRELGLDSDVVTRVLRADSQFQWLASEDRW